MADPRQEYLTRLEARRLAVATRSAKDARIAWLRLLTFGLFLGAAVLAGRGVASWWWLSLPTGLFLFLVRWHDAVIRARDEALRAVEYYERGLARIEDRWHGLGATGDSFQDPAHLYAADLDLFGQGSLFQLLSVARSAAGAHALADWLLSPARRDVIAERQEAVQELSGRVDLRERLWAAGAEAAGGVHPDRLIAWAESPPALPVRSLQLAAVMFSAAVVVTAVLGVVTNQYLPLLAVLVLEATVLYRFAERTSSVLHTAGAWSRELDVLAHVLWTLEGERVDTTALMRLRARLDSAGVSAKTAIGRLHRLTEMHDWQHNVIFMAVATPLLWGLHVALSMERWRAVHGPHVRTWIDVAGEFEALASLAAYRYEHPDDVFPSIEDTATARFSGIALGHPLLPAERMVVNDVDLGGTTRALVISGSNMSGKSTLLRTIGINAVLAFAGAPVRARSLQLSPLTLGATLRIQDSLQEGRSRFFAEITRLKTIVERAQADTPVLFLLDELFHGTNSHDRVIGATGVLRTLLGRGAIGLLTTHDLALVAVVDSLRPQAVNAHFEDTFVDGAISFDYRMKPGPVTRSNALALMRAVGLDVELGSDGDTDTGPRN